MSVYYIINQDNSIVLSVGDDARCGAIYDQQQAEEIAEGCYDWEVISFPASPIQVTERKWKVNIVLQFVGGTDRKEFFVMGTSALTVAEQFKTIILSRYHDYIWAEQARTAKPYLIGDTHAHFELDSNRKTITVNEYREPEFKSVRDINF
jgi:hypothetical protein